MADTTGISVHDSSRTELIRAFTTASDAQQKAFNAVMAAESALGSHWTGAAANQYRQAMHDWVGGLQKVREGLGSLEAAMQTYASQTDTTEDDNLMAASWFDPGSQPTASWT